MSNQSPTFRTSPAHAGYGPRIYIDAQQVDDHLTPDMARHLNSWSVWGGNTSSTPQKYLMWEFAFDGVNYVLAHILLRTSGWQVER